MIYYNLLGSLAARLETYATNQLKGVNKIIESAEANPEKIQEFFKLLLYLEKSNNIRFRNHQKNESMIQTNRLNAIPSLNFITETVCRASGTTIEQLRTKSKAPRLVMARTLIAHHARRQGHSLQRIGFLLHRSDATVFNYKSIYTRLSFRDKEFIELRNLVTVIIYT